MWARDSVARYLGDAMGSGGPPADITRGPGGAVYLADGSGTTRVGPTNLVVALDLNNMTDNGEYLCLTSLRPPQAASSTPTSCPGTRGSKPTSSSSRYERAELTCPGRTWAAWRARRISISSKRASHVSVEHEHIVRY